MAVTLTVGENTYVTQAEAQAFFDERLDASAWDSATSDHQIKALVSAFRRIEREQYNGVPTTDGQLAAWPRNGSEIVPQAVKDAQCVEALEILSSVSDSTVGRVRRARAAGLLSQSIGNTSESYAPVGGDPVGLHSPEARDLLTGLIRRGSAVL